MLLQMPKLGWILGFCAMASLGLPGLAGFWGEFPAILSAYNPAPGLSEALFRTLMVVAAIGTVLAAGYLLWLYQRTAFGEVEPGVRRRRPTPTRSALRRTTTTTTTSTTSTIYEWIAWTPLLIAIVVLGVYPQLMFKVLDPAVTNLVEVFNK